MAFKKSLAVLNVRYAGVMASMTACCGTNTEMRFIGFIVVTNIKILIVVINPSACRVHTSQWLYSL
jgi:hypothetical protein